MATTDTPTTRAYERKHPATGAPITIEAIRREDERGDVWFAAYNGKEVGPYRGSRGCSNAVRAMVRKIGRDEPLADAAATGNADAGGDAAPAAAAPKRTRKTAKAQPAAPAAPKAKVRSRGDVTHDMLQRPEGVTRDELVAEFDRVYGKGTGKASTAAQALNKLPKARGYKVAVEVVEGRGRVYRAAK